MLKKLISLISNKIYGKEKGQEKTVININTVSISPHLNKNKKILKEIFHRCEDLLIHEFKIGQKTLAFVVLFNSLTDFSLLQRHVLQALINAKTDNSEEFTITRLKEEILPVGRIKENKQWANLIENICKGSIGLFVEGQKNALLIDLFESDIYRTVSMPISEQAVRGPADAFNENLRINIGLLRKRLATSSLAVENLQIGKITKTSINLVYLKGYVLPGLIDEIKSRVGKIKIDGIVGSSQVEEYLQDNPYSIFSTIEMTERPDRLAAMLLEGSAALLFDGSPFALLLPCTLYHQLSTPDDYYNRYWFASLIRLIRLSALFLALLTPSLYIAIITYHQELIPTTLLISIATSREGIPYPAFLEALFMELTFELLREAGVRLPQQFGQTIGILGTVVIGQAAITAGLVSAIMVIIVSITAISAYAIPSTSLANSVRVLRYFFMFAAAFLGLFGIMAVMSILTFHLCSLRSFGIPYLTPLAPLNIDALKDSIIRLPAWINNLRPRLIGYRKPEKKEPNLKPRAPISTRHSQRKRR